MSVIPIVFCFDDNWELAAGVCITSLMENAKLDTFYDIFILHTEANNFHKNGILNKLVDKYHNVKITFRSVDSVFKNAFQIRGINTSTYYRLLIPEVIPEYDKIMYHDVDVIFRSDLSNIFISTSMDDYYIAGVVSSSGLSEWGKMKRKKLGLDWENYILAGNIIMNLKKLREDGIVERFKHEATNSKYEFQDMDIINIVCAGKIKRLAPSFCLTVGIDKLAVNRIEQSFYTLSELEEAHANGIIHYNGAKPWNEYCINFDYWWEYYRKSIFYDPKFYYDFYANKLNELDKFSLIKRLKLLLRFFLK